MCFAGDAQSSLFLQTRVVSPRWGGRQGPGRSRKAGKRVPTGCGRLAPSFARSGPCRVSSVLGPTPLGQDVPSAPVSACPWAGSPRPSLRLPWAPAAAERGPLRAGRCARHAPAAQVRRQRGPGHPGSALPVRVLEVPHGAVGPVPGLQMGGGAQWLTPGHTDSLAERPWGRVAGSGRPALARAWGHRGPWAPSPRGGDRSRRLPLLPPTLTERLPSVCQINVLVPHVMGAVMRCRRERGD